MKYLSKDTIRVFNKRTNLWDIWINTVNFNSTKELEKHFLSHFKAARKTYMFGLFNRENLVKILK